MRVCRSKREPVCDEQLDLLLPQKVEQDDQILSKQFWFQPFQPADAAAAACFVTEL
jgi:hypothetical protein